MKRKNISLSIVSGKGGVGKTNITLNLAYILHSLANQVIVIDCDLGLANLDILLGVTPKKNLKDLLSEDIKPEEIILSLDKTGLDFIPAASGVLDLLEYESDIQFLLAKKLDTILSKYDFILLDLGAGISNGILSFALSTSLRIVIITPEPTSLTDSYALIKILKNHYNQSNFFILVNMVENQQEAKKSFERLNVACQKFLGIELMYLGYVREDKNLSEAVRQQKPLFKLYPTSKACLDLINIAKKLINFTEKTTLVKKGLNLIDNFKK
ncbi:flagellar biosynthesis protein FlhG [Desulfonauticus submarinus]|uniref:Flagellar biosynthesis protein FlhG n=1 Tax=Desulfonauticus submarinus TaxID=206665 RepID=A0A1H0A6X5_9BACT|nr:MinD/ParA family protein [Desulfonauticus submarinus]SDN29389.1 flagellar biosynthesis protein FlhG [Desulfonauticus submarinus]